MCFSVYVKASWTNIQPVKKRTPTIEDPTRKPVHLAPVAQALRAFRVVEGSGVGGGGDVDGWLGWFLRGVVVER